MRRNFVQFRSLKPELVNVELQVHTTWTDGRSTIAEQLEGAQRRGLATIAFTKHVRRDTNWFVGFAAAVREEARRFPELTVLVGCEAKALDCPESCLLGDEDKLIAKVDFPLIVKQRVWAQSVGVELVRERQELSRAASAGRRDPGRDQSGW